MKKIMLSLLVLLICSGIVYASEIDYSCTLSKGVVNGKNIKQRENNSKLLKVQVKTEWYGKPIGIFIFVDGIKKRVVKNTQTTIEYLQSSKMTFKDETVDITMTKGSFSSMVMKITDDRETSIGNFNCIKD